MNLKKFALKGLIILAVCVAVCMFFSGTVKTIATAKVKLLTPRSGKLEEKLELLGNVTYPEVDKLTLEIPDGRSIVITKVNTRVGYNAYAGEVLIEADVENFDASMKACETAYNTAMEQMMDLENKSNVRVRKSDEEYAEAYFALRGARQDALKKQIDMEAQLDRAGLTLPRTGYPENADELLIAAIDAHREAQKLLSSAQSAYERAARYGVNEDAWNYITQRQELQDQMDTNQAQMRELTALRAQVAKLTAPHDGFVADLPYKVGDVITGEQSVFAITAEDAQPVLMADLTNVEKSVANGTKVRINTNRYGMLETEVVSSGTNQEGGKYAYIAITQDMINGMGSLYTMSQSDVAMTIVYKAKEATTLVPSSAVHGSGNDRYVFIVNRNYSDFGNTDMKVSKMNVTVLKEVDGTASIQESIQYYTLAYMEDRQINDGDSVMEYTD